MGSLISRPKVPHIAPAPAPVIQTPYIPPAAPQPVQKKIEPAQSTTQTPPAENTSATPPKDSAETARVENLLRRNRGKSGTILTGFKGLLSTNELAPQRKTLLGE